MMLFQKVEQQMPLKKYLVKEQFQIIILTKHILLFLLEQTLLVIGKEDLKKGMLLAETQTQVTCLI